MLKGNEATWFKSLEYIEKKVMSQHPTQVLPTIAWFPLPSSLNIPPDSLGHSLYHCQMIEAMHGSSDLV